MMTAANIKACCIALVVIAAASPARAENNVYGTGAGGSLSTGDGNVLLGENAGAGATSATYNVAVGKSAGAALGANDDNVVIGSEAGATKSFTRSMLVGARAGYNFDGSYAAYLGYEAGYSQTTQTHSIFAGSQAGYNANSSGTSRNIYLGYQTGYNISDNSNVAIGNQALYGAALNAAPAMSVMMGYRAGYGIGDNDGNVAFGEGAGYDLGSGGYNTLIGARAGENVQDNNNTPASYDYYASTMVGALAGLYSESGAISNSFLGVAAGSANKTGDYNVVVGAFADFTDWSTLTDSEIETIFESNIGSSTGLTALKSDAQWSVLVGAYGQLGADRTTALGYAAKALGDKSTALGSGATTSHVQAITIGYGASSHSDYGVVLGNDSTVAWHPHTDAVTALGSSSYQLSNAYARAMTSVADADSALTITLAADGAADAGDSWQLSVADGGDLTILNDVSGSATTRFTLANNGNLTANGDVNVLSDANFKKDIEAVGNALWLIRQLQTKRYYWTPESGRDHRQHSGLIAQQVEEILPELVRAESGADGFKSVNYPALLPLMAQASGELAEQQQQQETLMTSLGKRLDDIEAALNLDSVTGAQR